MKIENYLLKGDKVNSFVRTPNHGNEFKSGNLDSAILHYTAGPAETTIKNFTNTRTKASAHIVIHQDGRITQLAPFNIITYHAGASSHNGRSGMNNFSVGIEIENAGFLTRSGDIFRSWYGATFNSSEVIEAIHRNENSPRYWHTYTAEQIQSVFEVCELLIQDLGIKFILGHEEVSPGEKVDPGPAFPLDKLRSRILIERRDENITLKNSSQMRVGVSRLNIRSQPDSNGTKVAEPLLKGTKVKIIEKTDGWCKISTEIEGWVSSKFLVKD